MVSGSGNGFEHGSLTSLVREWGSGAPFTQLAAPGWQERQISFWQKPSGTGQLWVSCQPPSVPQVSATIGLQLVHCLPANPQLALVGDWQAPPSSQQPLGQLDELQTQTPPMQRWVGLQGGPLPQEQKPPRQVSAKLGSQVWQTSPPLPQLFS